MRTGVDRDRAPETSITFEGRTLPARRGETIAAALTAAGERAFRQTQKGCQRGVFCGMGVCQDCLVIVDGRQNQRACMTTIDRPVDVRRQTFPGEPDRGRRPFAPTVIDDIPVDAPDVLVVGGGAGGLAAAATAAEAGASVTLIDERPHLGGQFFKQPAALEGWPSAIARDLQFEDGRRAIERARTAGVRILSDTQVWGAFEPLEIAIAGASGARIVKPKRLIVATGAYERPWPTPGWTLPGVMTTGAAQTLLRSYRVAAGKRILIAGNGPLNFQVAAELTRAGAKIVAVAELASKPRAADAAALLAMATSSPSLLLSGLRLTAGLRAAGVPILYETAVAAIETEGDGLSVLLASRAAGGGVSQMIKVDALCLGYGFLPQNDIARALGCRHDFDSRRDQLVTVRGADCETTVANVFAVGDCCGLGGAPAAQEEGVIAGAAAARSLGRANAVADTTVAAARRRLARHRRFQSGLWRLFARADSARPHANADTIICRCEEITLGEIEAAIADDCPAIGEVKRRTRVGMGRCQGRYCAPILATLLAERQGRPLDEYAFFAPRAPIKPIPIEDLLGGESE